MFYFTCNELENELFHDILIFLDVPVYLPESAKYNSSILKSVQKLCSEWHTVIQLLLYCSMLYEFCE